MLRIEEEILILNGLVAQGSPGGVSGNTGNGFSCYNTELALFTTLPDIAGGNGTEVSLSGYSRVKLTGNSIGGNPLFGISAAWDAGEAKYKISNTAPIQMHSIDEDEQDTEAVLGFGIYAAESPTGESRLVAWGPLIDENGDPVTAANAPELEHGSVPVFYAGDFTLVFGGENCGMAAAECIGLLNTLVQQGSSSPTTGQTTYTLQTIRPELALFTTLPNAQGAGGVEVPEEIEVGGDTVETGYTRKALWGYTPTTGVLQFASSATFDTAEMRPAIQNTDEVQMSAIYPNISGNYKVLGFGIYAGTTSAGEPRLVAWGPLVDGNGDPVTAANAPELTGGSIPIFYAGFFKLMLGGEAGGGAFVPVSAVTLDPSTAAINSFASAVQLTAAVTPQNATVKGVKWTSSDETVAKVNANGAVSAASRRGEAVITVTTIEGSKTAACTVTSNTAQPTEMTATPAVKSIKATTGTTIPTADNYLAVIQFEIAPADVAYADREVVFEVPNGLLIKEQSETNGTITVYSRTYGTHTLRARLRNKHTITATCAVTVSN